MAHVKDENIRPHKEQFKIKFDDSKSKAYRDCMSLIYSVIFKDAIKFSVVLNGFCDTDTNY